MHKRVMSQCLAIGLIILLTGCGAIKNEIKVDQPKTKGFTPQQVQKEKMNANMPGFDGILKNTVEININFDMNGVYWAGGKPIQIKDSKIISDILTMVGESELLTDESKINNMSGMAKKNNKLVLVNQNKGKKEIIFAYDDPAFGLGYLEIDGQKYDPGYDFFRYIDDFSEYHRFDTRIENQVVELFKKYEWTVDYRINTLKETLPNNLKHEAGEYPVKIYWAYNNELSKSIGLDYSKYLGMKADVDIYRLREPLPYNMMNARGIVIKYDGKIIGAYIDVGRHDCFACSLNRKRLKDIINKDWDQWVENYIDFDNKLEIKLSRMQPEDIIKEYYEALNSGDEKMWAACMTREALCSYLSMNMDNNYLFNKNFDGARFGKKSNIKSVKLLKLSNMDGIDNPKGTIEYAATIDLKVREIIACDSGVQPRFLLLKKESEKSGWRIQGEGTGP